MIEAHEKTILEQTKNIEAHEKTIHEQTKEIEAQKKTIKSLQAHNPTDDVVHSFQDSLSQLQRSPSGVILSFATPPLASASTYTNVTVNNNSNHSSQANPDNSPSRDSLTCGTSSTTPATRRSRCSPTNGTSSTTPINSAARDSPTNGTVDTTPISSNPLNVMTSTSAISDSLSDIIDSRQDQVAGKLGKRDPFEKAKEHLSDPEQQERISQHWQTVRGRIKHQSWVHRLLIQGERPGYRPKDFMEKPWFSCYRFQNERISTTGKKGVLGIDTELDCSGGRNLVFRLRYYVAILFSYTTTHPVDPRSMVDRFDEELGRADVIIDANASKIEAQKKTIESLKVQIPADDIVQSFQDSYALLRETLNLEEQHPIITNTNDILKRADKDIMKTIELVRDLREQVEILTQELGDRDMAISDFMNTIRRKSQTGKRPRPSDDFEGSDGKRTRLSLDGTSHVNPSPATPTPSFASASLSAGTYSNGNNSNPGNQANYVADDRTTNNTNTDTNNSTDTNNNIIPSNQTDITDSNTTTNSNAGTPTTNTTATDATAASVTRGNLTNETADITNTDNSLAGIVAFRHEQVATFLSWFNPPSDKETIMQTLLPIDIAVDDQKIASIKYYIDGREKDPLKDPKTPWLTVQGRVLNSKMRDALKQPEGKKGLWQLAEDWIAVTEDQWPPHKRDAKRDNKCSSSQSTPQSSSAAPSHTSIASGSCLPPPPSSYLRAFTGPSVPHIPTPHASLRPSSPTSSTSDYVDGSASES
ncbi:hypothetical protein HK102_013294 [Quaeritorhiza haematococci]|nr:hypothetical protein HK102_013294 [Quaeritorhiza haematococci]